MASNAKHVWLYYMDRQERSKGYVICITKHDRSTKTNMYNEWAHVLDVLEDMGQQSRI